MKKVVIIGAGIAGLTCAVYVRLNGFETELYEMHAIPGGECTGWDRGDYHFDGCIHWLMGTKEGTGLNGIWRDTGALNDTVKIANHEVFSRYEEDGHAVNFYTDVDRLEKHLKEVSPQDKREIGKLCRAMRILTGMGMPVDKPMDMMTAKEGIGFALSNLRKMMKMSRYGKMTVADLAERFTQPLLKRALLSVIPADNPAYALVMTLASMNDGDSGYPLGGSRALARRMEKRFTDLGGRITCKAKVDKIIVEDGRAVGIRLADGTEVMGDYIVSCADGYATLYRMLEDKYTPDMYRNLFANPHKYATYTCSLVFMGVDAALTDYRSVVVRRAEPVELNGIREENINLLNYGFDNVMAPQGKTVMVCYYVADYDYWHALHADKEKYAAGKKRLMEDAAAQVIARHPEAAGRIEVTDVVTPVTYERYCNAWRGSWMTWSGGGEDVPRYYPGLLPGLSNFIMAGMWTQPPGGLPGAGMAGRSAAYRLCMMEGLAFKTE